jgi:hypothetical protein
MLETELIGLYLDTMDIIQSTNLVTGKLSAYHTAAAALTALTWHHRVGNHKNMGIGSKLSMTGTNVYNVGPIIKERMEDFSRASEDFRESRQNGDDTWRIRLWCFYVGAVVEPSIPGVDPSEAIPHLRLCSPGETLCSADVGRGTACARGIPVPRGRWPDGTIVVWAVDGEFGGCVAAVRRLEGSGDAPNWLSSFAFGDEQPDCGPSPSCRQGVCGQKSSRRR